MGGMRRDIGAGMTAAEAAELSASRSMAALSSYLNVMTLMDVYYHVDEADHVVRMLMPERQFF
jgi:hypothetical protein